MTSRRRQLPDNFDQVHLTAEDFHVCYTLFVGLRFPLDVSEVLDLRYLINHAADDFSEPPLTPDYRQFLDAREAELDAAAIETPTHRQRLLKIMTLMRELHVAHSLKSRAAEQNLRRTAEENGQTRRKTVRTGIADVLLCIAGMLAWLSLPAFALPLQILSLTFAVQAFRNFRSLPRLDKDAESLRQQLNNALRERVDAIDWRMLTHKLSLVLGFKKVKGVQVFLGDAMTDSGRFSRSVH